MFRRKPELLHRMMPEERKTKLVSDTKIYLDCRKLLDAILDVIPSFPRTYKFTIGSQMQDIGVNLLTEAAAAYMVKDRRQRLQHLETFQYEFQTLKTLLRLSFEREWLRGLGKYADIIELTDEIGKQSSAWKNSLTKVMG